MHFLPILKVECFLNCFGCPDRSETSTCRSLKSQFKTRIKPKETKYKKVKIEQCFYRGGGTLRKKNCGKGKYRITEGKLHHQRIFLAPVYNEVINGLVSQFAQNCASKRYWGDAFKIYQDKASFKFSNTYKSCAFVASGENLLDHEYGKSIDSHDLVVRSNGPFKGYQKFIGERTDVLIIRKGRAKKMRGLERMNVDRLCILFSDQEVPSTCSNITVAMIKKEEAMNFWIKVYEAYTNDASYKTSLQGVHAPSGGSIVLLSFLNSGLCESWSIYGVSPIGSGHYFTRLLNKPVSWIHLVGLEYYIFTALESLGVLCVV